VQKCALRRVQQQQRAGPTPGQARQQQWKQQAEWRVQPLQVNNGARRQARPQRNSVRRIRLDGRHAREQQDREGDEAAPAGHRIQCPGDRGGEKQEDGMGNVQTPVYQKMETSAKRFSCPVHSALRDGSFVLRAICINYCDHIFRASQNVNFSRFYRFFDYLLDTLPRMR
jgi:hypothetical protein